MVSSLHIVFLRKTSGRDCGHSPREKNFAKLGSLEDSFLSRVQERNKYFF